MQPARDEVVQNLTVPASAASASARRGAMMSLPSWPPCPRGSPKSSVVRTRAEDREDESAAPFAARRTRPPHLLRGASRVTVRRIPRAVVRRGVIESGSRSKGGSLAGVRRISAQKG